MCGRLRQWATFGSLESFYAFSGPPLMAVSSPDGEVATEAQLDEIPSLLARRFGLPGFGLGPDGRVIAVS